MIRCNTNATLSIQGGKTMIETNTTKIIELVKRLTGLNITKLGCYNTQQNSYEFKVKDKGWYRIKWTKEKDATICS